MRRVRAGWVVVLAGVLHGCAETCVTIAAGAVCGTSDATLPIVHADGWAVVDVIVDGRPGRALIDTGAGGTFASATFLGADVGWKHVRSLCLGDVCVLETMVWAEDTEITPPNPGPDRVDVIVGTNILADAVVELDRGESIRIAFGGQPCAGEALAVELDEHLRPFAPVTASDVSIERALLDTGSRYCLLGRAEVDAAGGLSNAAPDELCTLDGCVPAVRGEIGELCVGGSCEPGVTVKTPGGPIVGDSFFNRARYAFDLGSARMIRCD
jgi:hypothetical protein